MEVKAKVDLEVNGKKHKKGDKFDMTNSAAAYQAARDGHVEIIEPAKASK
jgi:hypothetical protein